MEVHVTALLWQIFSMQESFQFLIPISHITLLAKTEIQLPMTTRITANTKPVPTPCAQTLCGIQSCTGPLVEVYQCPTNDPRITERIAMASSKHGQSSTGSGWKWTRARVSGMVIAGTRSEHQSTVDQARNFGHIGHTLQCTHVDPCFGRCANHSPQYPTCNSHQTPTNYIGYKSDLESA